jgi:hypothetical protein
MNKTTTTFPAALALVSLLLSSSVLGMGITGPVPHDMLVGSGALSSLWSVGANDPVTNERSGGLNITTFGTLHGTVTVNLPDDLASGDTISGTVIAEPKESIGGQPAKDQDEIKGYVVEIADQTTPPDKVTGNLTDPCGQTASAASSNSVTTCSKVSIPEGRPSIPVVLKDKDGKTVARTDIPVAPKADPAKAAVDFFLPPVGQAGRPISVKGPFDGNFKSTGIKIGNLSTKFLASSPRKVVVESPRDLNGVSDISVEYMGKIVAQCSYRNISVKLAAGQLNLINGEQTTLTVSLAGLIGLLRPVSLDLSNNSPGTISMTGGNMQAITVSPSEVNGDVWKTTRTLNGISAGGFSINAIVDAKSVAGCETNENAGTPLNKPNYSPEPPDLPNTPPGPKPAPTPAPQPTPPEPRPTPTPAESRANFEVSLFRFTVDRNTRDDVLQRDGAGDEVSFSTVAIMHDRRTGSRVITDGMARTGTFGQNPPNSIRAGRATTTGGLITHDDVLLGPVDVLFSGELARGDNAATIILTVWEMDGPHGLNAAYQNFVDNYGPDFERVALGSSAGTSPLVRDWDASFTGGTAGGPVATVVTLTDGPLGLGEVNDRPIGMTWSGRIYNFAPKIMILNFDNASRTAATNTGSGLGVIKISYTDDERLGGGSYTLYVRIRRL